MDRARTVALFPGAFKPPHPRHLGVIDYLLGREDVDEVKIIVSNRARVLPGSDAALGTDVALNVWRILLEGRDSVSVEAAEKTAVARVREYVETCTPSVRLLLCIGEEDFNAGDGRFDDLGRLAEQRNVDARIVVAPAVELRGRATELRACLSKGEAGREEFFDRLGLRVSGDQKARIWQACRNGQTLLGELSKSRVRQSMEAFGLDANVELESICADNSAVQYSVKLADDDYLLVKDCNDELPARTPERDFDYCPRHRLSAERRAIEWVTSAEVKDLICPRIELFDKGARLMVLGNPARPRVLEPQLRFHASRELFSGAAAWLAALHAQKFRPSPIRGTWERESQWWQSRLSIFARVALAYPELAAGLQRMSVACASRARRGVFHFSPQVRILRLVHGSLAVLDWENCGGFGDPAFDVGCLLGSATAALVRSGDGNHCPAAKLLILKAYQSTAVDKGALFVARTLAFSGAHILNASGCGNDVDGELQSWGHTFATAGVEDLDPQSVHH